MKTLPKIALILLGYVVAWLAAEQAVAIHTALTAADSKGADGMYAFGDSLLFIGVAGSIALIPTGAAIYFMRGSQSPWTWVSYIALAIAATGTAAVCLLIASDWAPPGGLFGVLSGFSFIRLLASPLLAPVLLVCGAFAPAPASPPRKRIFIAGGLEALSAVYLVCFMFLIRH